MLAVVGQDGRPIGSIARLPLTLGDREQIRRITALEGDRFDDRCLGKLLQGFLPNLGIDHLIRECRDLIRLLVNTAVEISPLGGHLYRDRRGSRDRGLGDRLQTRNSEQRNRQLLRQCASEDNAQARPGEAPRPDRHGNEGEIVPGLRGQKFAQPIVQLIRGIAAQIPGGMARITVEIVDREAEFGAACVDCEAVGHGSLGDVLVGFGGLDGLLEADDHENIRQGEE